MNAIHNRMPCRILALVLCVILLIPSLPAQAAEEPFRYEHDPRLNPAAMADILVDPTAVYGFSPSPEGSLKQYADYDWTDPDAVNGENGRQARIAYHESISKMYTLLDQMREEGSSIEEIARAVSTLRNQIRLEAYADDPEALARAKARNLERYGHEEGPLPEELYAQYGSWDMVIEKAFSTNSGMDACLGLYDDYYDLYVTVGQVEPEKTAAVAREYAITVIMEALQFPEAEGAVPAVFPDADTISAWAVAAVSAASAGGIIKGYRDGTLRPKQEITRVEAFVILSRCLPDLPAVRAPVPFQDVPGWAQADMDRLSASGLVNGYGNGRLGAYDSLTVEQLKSLMARLPQ